MNAGRWHGVFVDGDGAAQGASASLSIPCRSGQPGGGRQYRRIPYATLNEGFSHGLSVLNNLGLVGFVFRSHGFFEAHGFCSDDVHQRAAL